VVGGIGLVYVAVFALRFVAPTPLGLVPAGSTLLNNLVHLAVLAPGLAVLWLAARRLTALIVGD
jgi:hypothetical protein